MGAICHTINPRLSGEQMRYIIGHAQDRVLFFDLTFLPIVEALAPDLPEDMRFVCLCDAAHMPESAVDLLCYEDLLAAQTGAYDWPEMDENTAAGLCYTSGTTGAPKGALYSHRSNVLHAFSTLAALKEDLKEGARVLPVVPLFHVNAWGLPYIAPLAGASLAMPRRCCCGLRCDVVLGSAHRLARVAGGDRTARPHPAAAFSGGDWGVCGATIDDRNL